jgi:hypothetical protein
MLGAEERGTGWTDPAARHRHQCGHLTDSDSNKLRARHFFPEGEQEGLLCG